jgi:hypothetical protein
MGRKQKNEAITLSRTQQEEILKYSYLELGPTYKLATKSPFASSFDKEDVPQELVRIMSDPRYVGFTCKHLLNFNCFPYQLTTLYTLWTRVLIIFLASRGGSKTTLLGMYCILRALFDQGVKIVVAGAGLRQSGLVFGAMDQIWEGAPILRDICGGQDNRPKRDILGYKWNIGRSSIIGVPLGCLTPDSLITTPDGIMSMEDMINNRLPYIWSQGEFRPVGGYLNNGITPTKKITTTRGFQVEGTHNHKIKVVRENKIRWVRLDEMVVGDYVMLDRGVRWFEPSFEYTDDQAYALGLLIGDGCWTNKYTMKFTSADSELVDAVAHGIGSPARCYNEKYQHFFTGKKNREFTEMFGVDRHHRSWEKVLPSGILSASQTNMAACLSGLFDTDGCVQVKDDPRGGVSAHVTLYTTSQSLAKQVQYVLLHFGIISTLGVSTNNISPRTGKAARDCYEVRLSGVDVKLFSEKIGFRLSRKAQILQRALDSKSRWVSITDTVPVDKELLLSWCEQYGWGSKEIKRAKRISRKLLQERIMNKFVPGSSELVWLEKLADPNICYDQIVDIEDGEQVTVDINVPSNNEYIANGFFSHNTGERIRGLRANVIICDEFSSISPTIFETVIRGFAAVQSQNTFEKVQYEYQKQVLEDLGLIDVMDEEEEDKWTGNQIIISGTANYQFNHFFKYYEDYCSILLNHGRVGGGNVSNWRDYAVIRIPYEQLPKGLMDTAILEQGAAIMDSTIFQMEYQTIFPKDSSGFYPASVIHGATTPVKWGDQEICFTIELAGDPASQYVMGIDPASERDNLVISIAKLCDGYAAHVYTWAANRKSFEEDKRKHPQYYEGIRDYNTFIVRKIHELARRFNIVQINLDAGGGGTSLIEGLKDPSKLEDGESLLFNMDDPEVAGEKGQHIIRLRHFTKRDWYEAAHYNLLKDLSSRKYLFPEYDFVGIEQVRLKGDDPLGNLVYDTIEGISNQIETVKYQTTLIEEASTAKGMKKWDLPKLTGVLTSDITAKLRKDHFTSLLLCCDAVRDYINDDRSVPRPRGGYAAKDLQAPITTQGPQSLYQGRGLGRMRTSSGNQFFGSNLDEKSSGGSVAF